jgi:diguanylate cyclase (GGDEF)-like protein/PAS domain S-box-containing protein
VRFNAGILQALGKTAAELVGTSALDNVIAADRPMVAAKIREAIEIGRTEAEIGLRHGDGSEHHYVMTASRTKLSEGAGIMGIGIDVTEARRIERLLHESEERFRAIFASVTDAILLRDFETLRVVEANESACAMFASSRDALIGTRATDLSADIAGDLEQEVERRFADARRGAVSNFEWLSKARDGRIFPTEVSLRRITLGGRPFFLATLHDISERKRAEAKIVQMARFDGLTGLANRVVFTEALEKAIGYVRRGGQGFAVLYLDLDHFKDINDTLGHPMGDALLKEVAARLRGAVRDIDTVARFGGDEFAVLETNIADPTDAGLLAGRLLELLAEPYTIHGNTISSSASIGIAISGAEPVDAESLLSGADVALYRAKSEERGTYRFFTSAMDAEVRHRVETSNDLRGALASGQIFLEYQPQVDATNGQIVGLEALARWRHPQRGLVPPLEFIPIAERNGLINALGLWILRESCRQMRAWRDAGLTPPAIAVNLSAVQFKASQNLEAEIGQAIQDYGLRPGELELELTESVLMDAARNHNDVLVRLRSRGVRLAIDDFGTGYSSLDYLRRFPVDRIKIAQEFITDLDSKAENGIIVRAAIGLSRELGISILAEGVETRAQLDLLDQWGCRNIQGFYFSRPVPAMQAELLLRRGRIDPLERAVA